MCKQRFLVSESPLSQGKLDTATLMRNLARFCWVMYLRAGKQKQTAPRSWFTCQRVQPGPGPRLSRAHAGCSSLLLTAALKRALRILEREISALPSKTSSKPWGLSRTPAEPVLLSPSKALCAFTALRFVCLFVCLLSCLVLWSAQFRFLHGSKSQLPHDFYDPVQSLLYVLLSFSATGKPERAREAKIRVI